LRRRVLALSTLLLLLPMAWSIGAKPIDDELGVRPLIGSAAQAQASSQVDPNQTVYVTKTGTKYHRTGCRSLAKSSIPMTLKDAVAKGYGPCSICKPPTLSTTSTTSKPTAPTTSTTPPAPSGAATKATPAGNGDVTVYVTKSGTKYHRAGCRSLAKSSIPMALKDAVAKGLTPCSVCKPPVLEKK
jgi:competence protein ComEC